MGIPGIRAWHQLCFNADPNDTVAVPIWQDYTHLVRKIGTNRRGRQYELAQTVGAAPTLMFRDVGGIFNPANASSVQYPNVQPYRQVLSQVMYPPAAVGGAVNLINSGRWKPNNISAPDPSFEAYANGEAMPNWLTALGSVVPTITTTNPQQGTKSLTYAVAATGDRQGASWVADCIPGVEYTSSAYVRQSSASTQALLVGGQTLGYDDFSRTVAPGGWGTASDFGGAYTVTGTASDYSVSAGTGLQSNGTLNSRRLSTLAAAAVDSNQVITITAPSGLSAGSELAGIGLAARYIDANNFYRVTLVFGFGVDIRIGKTVAGAVTVMTDEVVSQFWVPGQTFFLRFEATAETLRAKVWSTDDLEPGAWNTEVNDTSLSAAGSIGPFSILGTGVADPLPVVFTFDNYRAVGSTASSTTTTTGSYVRLSETFTATQPTHTITLATAGTAVAGQVNIDAIQHEQGSSAGTFSTSGPVIFPDLHDYVERWPREYEAAGFVGIANTPAVDGFAALNAIAINTDYVTALLDLKPDYYWALGGGTSSGAVPEVSGNGGPFLFPAVSKYGAGTAPSFGASIPIDGDYGATGVSFTETTSSSTATGTILAAGTQNDTPGVLWPSFGSAAYPPIWGASLSCWVLIRPTTLTASIMRMMAPNASTGLATSVLFIQYDSGQRGVATTSFAGNSGGTSAGSSPALDDGLPHHIVATITQADSPGDTTLEYWLDGELISSVTVTTASLGGLYDQLANTVQVGGFGGSEFFSTPMNGTVAHAAAWSRALSAADIAALWSAGQGHPGELPGDRLTRHLSAGRYTGATRISTGSTPLQPATWSGSIDLLTDAQNLAQAELGNTWMAPDGALVFEGRQDRWLRLTPVAVFGEDVASGEIPYLEGILFDFDPMFVAAHVRITRNGGAMAIGGTRADISTAVRKYFGRTYAIGIDAETDVVAQSYADYVFNTHKAPVQRVGRITVDMSANPILFASVLLLECGQRVTVKRREKAANGGAGLTMSADYFIEAVEHHERDMDKGVWKVSFLLSPVGLAPGVTMQPWILSNSTYSVLNSTTILGF